MLDVAAVADALLAPYELTRARRNLLCLMVALHDLGKIGAEFRAMIQHGQPQSRRHWELTEVWLIRNEKLLLERLGGTRHGLRPLIAAVAGHHGRPPSASEGGLGTVDDFEAMARRAGPEAEQDATTVILNFLEIWPEARLDLSSVDAKRLSWWLSGLTVVADWVASNPEWFPPRGPDLGPLQYLEFTQQQVPQALAEAGLTGAAVRAEPLFNFALRPMQEAASQVSLPDGPMLAILEDETGSGKTEAALILAQRMLLARKGRGLYVALPTMATADAMFARAEKVIGCLFQHPSLTLAHGRSGLSEQFREVVGRERASDDVTCAPWLADSRRRALLADVGIGTVDQALLAVLPTKFSTLRQWGLSSKILIVDEVHELGNPYMARQLEALLRLHAMQGGSAILLTATLPLKQRERLMSAFEVGAGRAPLSDPDPAYPSLVVAGGAAVKEFAVGPSPKGSVAVKRIDSTEAVADLLAEAARQGAAGVWVRNAVDDAIAGVALLQARGVEAELLHARFTLCDRKVVEARALGRFGKDGEGRAGRVLVATQVVEASLDLDFDAMVSDLAPMAALVQRAGRLWRHLDRRPREARPVAGPVLHVLSPDPGEVAGPQWLHKVLASGAWVYPVPDQWRTADVLFRAGEIVVPGGLRDLIEAVHGDQVRAVPEVLQRAEDQRIGASYAEDALARHNVVEIDQGYREAGRGMDDREYPTRLGGETRPIVLARRIDDVLRPWAGGKGSAEDWMLSEVAAQATRLAKLRLPDQRTAEIVAATWDWPEWKRESVTVCPVGDDGTICEGLRYRVKTGLEFL
ncbi:CRISPR-associated helicase Cas3' [Rubellimicrobium roseum]|uniref:CRISPR-associated helicase Cas3 n=2 Tax=Rubellimicrobium roseum TaxID=687525 RepID=A0A5C4NHY8_9RHOB|nr:CRISPR-associated helicase Cas3' [Rubellimicrobium roseum]